MPPRRNRGSRGGKKAGKGKMKGSGSDAPSPLSGDGAPPKLVVQLSSEDAEERAFACGALASEINNAELIPMLLDHGVSSMLIGLLSDEEPFVCGEAAAALRNLFIGGDESLRARLLAENVLPPLGGAMSRLHEALLALKGAEVRAGDLTGRQQDIDTALRGLLHTLVLLSELSQHSNDALLFAGEQNLDAIVVACLQPEYDEVALAASQCLVVLSEDNPRIAALVTQNPEVITLLEANMSAPADSGRGALIKAASLATVFNIRDAAPAGCEARILAAIAEMLSVDLAAELAGAVASASDESVLETATQYMQAQRQALEVLANYCTVEPDPSASEEEAAAYMEQAGQRLSEAVLSSGLLSAVMLKTQSVAEDVQRQLSGLGDPGRSVLRAYNGLQACALGCLNNILMVADLVIVGEPFLVEAWGALMSLATAPPVGCVEGFVHDVTGTLWSLLRGWCTTDGLGDLFSPPAEHVSSLCDMVGLAGSDDVRVDAAGIVGILGQVPVMAQHMEHFAGVLMHGALTDGSHWVSAECLNSIFDVFAEPDFNEVVAAQEMLPQLQELMTGLRQLLKTEKRAMDPELHGRLSETFANLQGFLRYKAEQF